MSGPRLSVSYGYIPCMLGLCGPEDKRRKKAIIDYLNGKLGEKEIRKIILEFKAAYPYYKLIAKCNKIADPLDQKVIEAYWCGNPLLKKVKFSDYVAMMTREFLPLGKMPKEKIDKLPKKAIPYHTFHVLFIGSVTGRFQESEKGLDLCRVSWGKVEKIEKDKLTVLRQSLVFGKKIKLGKPELKKLKLVKSILSEVKVGDWVSIHWGTAVEKLDKAKLENIKKYMKHTLDIIN